MRMSEDRVPSMNIESPYGEGVSSLPGATGSLLLVKFPAAPVLLAGGPQLGSWQVAVVRGRRDPCGIGNGQLKYLSCMTVLDIPLLQVAPLARVRRRLQVLKKARTR